MTRSVVPGLLLLSAACGRGPDPSPEHVGREACAPCHAEETARWVGSHHDLAMQPATEETVLGDFSGVTFASYGRETVFFRRNGAFVVRTDGPTGSVEEYEIVYTFGVEPLQQYLIRFPGGRLQAFAIAWDTRPAARGGQRWFHLYPDEDIEPGDPLHWTGLNHTWNQMCAACHSTNLAKNFDARTGTYETTWSEIDVSCEACHGPGSAHVAWAQRDGAARAPEDNGLVVRLAREAGAPWRFPPGERIARRDAAAPGDGQIDACAPCHSRRQSTRNRYQPGDGFLDAHRVALLEPLLYFADGQIQDEVYVYGSFAQSAMRAAGVVCSDCHDPHSARVYDDGNGLCTRCHLPAAYDGPEHHFHPAESDGARCVECHMPARTYMVVDARRDHSLRVPRPDLSVTLGTPNACTQCHTDRTATWAERAVTQWYGGTRAPHFAEALHAGRTGVPGADADLAALASDTSQPGIVRGTALELLGRYVTIATRDVLVRLLDDPDPLVRYGAARASEALPPDARYALLFQRLDDSVAMVRDEVGRLLAPVSPDVVRDQHRAAWERAVSGYVASQEANADRGESHLNVSLLHLGRGELAAADSALGRALAIDSSLVPAYVNLADLRRAQGRDREGEALLAAALRRAPDNAAARHAMGLYLVRAGRHDEARRALEAAARLDPDDARFQYVYGVALHSAGRVDSAAQVLQAASARHPHDVDIVTMLVAIDRERGDLESAIRRARRLVEIAPSDPRAGRLLASLLGEGRR